MDHYFERRQQMIDTLQGSLRPVRQVLGLSGQELGEIIGLTRQTINNLETLKNRMSATQYVAICAVIDHFAREKPELPRVIDALLGARSGEADMAWPEGSAHGGSLLKRWFLCFPDDSKVVDVSSPGGWGWDERDLQAIARRYKIFLDESSLCHERAESFTRRIEPYLTEEGSRLIIPLRVVESIQKRLLEPDARASAHGRAALELLGRMQAGGLIEIRGEKKDPDVESTILSAFSRYKVTNRLMLVTQREPLARGVLDLNDSELDGFTIMAARLSAEGELEPWDFSGPAQNGPEPETEPAREEQSFPGWDEIY